MQASPGKSVCFVAIGSYHLAAPVQYKKIKWCIVILLYCYQRHPVALPFIPAIYQYSHLNSALFNSLIYFLRNINKSVKFFCLYSLPHFKKPAVIFITTKL